MLFESIWVQRGSNKRDRHYDIVCSAREAQTPAGVFQKDGSRRLEKEQVRRILQKAESLRDEREKELADSVLQVCIAANRKIVEELKGEESMCQALREIMKPELEQSRKDGLAEGIERGIERGIGVTVSILRGLGQTEESIKESIMENYALSQDAAEKYMTV